MKQHKKAVLCRQAFEFPKKISALGVTYTIKTKKVVMSGEVKCAGLFEFEKKLITIKIQSGDEMMVSLWHELSHMFVHLTDVSFRSVSEEVYCHLSGLFWGQVFRQIPIISSIPVKKTKQKKKSR